MLICALLGVLAAQFIIPRSSQVPRLARATPRVVSPVPVGAVGDYPQILSRPLFTPTRNPSDSGLAGASANVRISDYSVLGTAIARGLATAVMRGPGEQTRSLRVGDTLLGWRVASIRRDGVVLEGAGGERTVPVTGGAPAPGMIR